ncbi:hypothetical protein ACH52_2483 [Eubacterium limosum]|nr:hypothetical protein ACH52_2483 [Eubacterium limosum]
MAVICQKISGLAFTQRGADSVEKPKGNAFFRKWHENCEHPVFDHRFLRWRCADHFNLQPLAVFSGRLGQTHRIEGYEGLLCFAGLFCGGGGGVAAGLAGDGAVSNLRKS